MVAAHRRCDGGAQPGGDLLGEDNPRRIVADHRDLPPGAVLDRVIRRVSDWSEGAAFEDDVTLVVLEC